MPEIIFSVGQDTPHGVTLARGVVSVRPLTRRIENGVVIARATYTMNLETTATVNLSSTKPGEAWIISILPRGGDLITGYYSVKETDTLFSDLVAIDPATLPPVGSPEPAWWAMAGSTVNVGYVVGDDLILIRTDGVEVNAGHVRGPQGDPGPIGSRILTGTGAPIGTGKTGDIYIDEATGNLWKAI